MPSRPVHQRVYSNLSSKEESRLMDKRVENKAHLLTPIVRQRIQESLFYKQHLHLANELALVPVVVNEVHFVGGTDDSGRPSPFLCCLLRMLELEPLDEIVQLYLSQNGYNEFKYLTAMALLYCRMVSNGPTVYSLYDQYIEDYRKLRVQLKTPKFVQDRPIRYELSHLDEWVELLVTSDVVVDVTLPYLNPRLVYVDRGEIEPRRFIESDSDSDYQSDSD